MCKYFGKNVKYVNRSRSGNMLSELFTREGEDIGMFITLDTKVLYL